MGTLEIILGVLLCLAVVHCKRYDGRQNDNNRYQYPNTSPTNYPERREYDRNQYDRHNDLLERIVHLLEDISFYVRRSQQQPLPPQPIYIPYPVPNLPYPVSQNPPTVPSIPETSRVTNAREVPDNPTLIGSRRKSDVSLLTYSRYPDKEDGNDNWGIKPEEYSDEEKDDGARPNSFDPIKPERPLRRPAPNVEHGTIQYNCTLLSEVPKFDDVHTDKPVAVNTTAT